MDVSSVSPHLILVLVLAMPIAGSPPTAFQLTFTSNEEVFNNHEVQLDHPLPDWINGLHVSNHSICHLRF